MERQVSAHEQVFLTKLDAIDFEAVVSAQAKRPTDEERAQQTTLQPDGIHRVHELSHACVTLHVATMVMEQTHKFCISSNCMSCHNLQ